MHICTFYIKYHFAMNNLKSIKEVAQYYVERYKLPTAFRAGSYTGSEDGLRGYISKITKLLEDVKIGSSTLLDACTPKDGGVRKISIEEFEAYCLEKWAKYIRKNLSGFDDSQVEKDLQKKKQARIELLRNYGVPEGIDFDEVWFKPLYDENGEEIDVEVVLPSAWLSKGYNSLEEYKEAYSKEAIFKNRNEMAEQNLQKEISSASKQIKESMMLEALFSVFYDPIDTHALAADIDALYHYQSNPEKQKEYEAAKSRLSDFNNYTKRKSGF